jgi:hypothetical protein
MTMTDNSDFGGSVDDMISWIDANAKKSASAPQHDYKVTIDTALKVLKGYGDKVLKDYVTTKEDHEYFMKTFCEALTEVFPRKRTHDAAKWRDDKRWMRSVWTKYKHYYVNSSGQEERKKWLDKKEWANKDGTPKMKWYDEAAKRLSADQGIIQHEVDARLKPWEFRGYTSKDFDEEGIKKK